MFNNPCSFVQRTFPPMIGCISSSSVEQICQKNNLSFVEMLRPFCALNLDHKLRDPSGNDHVIKHLQICIQDVNDRPPQPSLAKKLLNESVSNAQQEVTKSMVVNNVAIDIPAECKWFHSWTKTFLLVQYPSDHEFTKHLLGCLLVTSALDPPETLQTLLQSLQQMQAVAPSKLPKWFSSNIFKYYVVVHDVRDGDKDKALQFFSSLKNSYGQEHCFFLEINSQHQQAPSTVIHDYWIHYVLNKNQEPNGSDHGSSPRTPAETNSLGAMPNTFSNEGEATSSSGCSPEMGQEAVELQQPVVFLHPLSPDIEVTSLSASNVNQLQNNDVHNIINVDVWSGIQGSYQHGNFLTPHDIGNIKNLIKNLVVHVLIPHVEKQIFHLSDLVSNKKGVSRSLLSATKRLFGASKPGSPGGTSSNSVIYTADAPELQLRRLGDLYFMFTNYSLAFQAYHSAKRDFASDQAYVYLAGALEMAALSAFMQGDMSRKILDYMEEAILTYLNSCKLPQFASRSTLLSTQFLKGRQMFGEAAKQLIRMTSEDSDLRSALLLEQASYCFLYSTRPNMSRKYAFHMVLAGHRFSKAGHRKHALRCYKQAFQIYQNKGWNLAEDHIHFTIGRLSRHLKLLYEGTTSLFSLLSSGSKQTPGQQTTYLREYLQMLQMLHNEDPKKDLNVLPLPLIEDNSIQVLVSETPVTNIDSLFEPDSPADSVRWAKMEELVLTESHGVPMIFRPTIHVFSKNTCNTVHPITAVGEIVYVQVSLRNPLQIMLPLLRVKLLWNFCKLDGDIVSSELGNEDLNSLIQTNILESINIDPCSSRQVTLTLIPHCPGQVDILGMQYKLACPSGNVQQTDIPAVKGKQLFVVRGPRIKIKKERIDAIYEKDNRLNIKVIVALPLLQLQTENFKSNMLSGEIQRAVIKVRNSGNAPLRNLCLITSSPQLFSLHNEYVQSEKIISDGAMEGIPQEYGESFKGKNNTYKLIKITLPNNGLLKASEQIILPLWIRAPDVKDLIKIEMLFYYETLSEADVPRYRVARFSQRVSVSGSLQLNASVSRSNLCEDKDTMNISLTVQNVNQNRDFLGSVIIRLVQLSLATWKWKLQPKAIFSKDLKLNTQESYSFIVRANRSSEGNSEISDICLQEEKVDLGCMQPYYDFYKWHIYEDTDESSENLYKMVLCLRWKGIVTCSDKLTEIIIGQSHVTLTDLSIPSVWPRSSKCPPTVNDQVEILKIFGPERRLSVDKKLLRRMRLENALSYSLLHDHMREHSFPEKRICRVEMKLILRNCIDFPLRVMINTPGVKYLRPTVTRSQLYTPHSSSTFTWASRSNALVQIDGNERCNVMLAAAFTAPGTYDLGSRLTVAAAAEDDSEFIVQLCSVESSIIILDKNKKKKIVI